MFLPQPSSLYLGYHSVPISSLLSLSPLFLCRILSVCQSSKLGTPHGSVLDLLLLSLDVTYLGDSLIIQSLWSPPFLAHGPQTALSLVLGPTLGVILTPPLSSLVCFSPNGPVNLQLNTSKVRFITAPPAIAPS